MGFADPAAVEEAYAACEAAQARLASLDYSGLDVPTLLALQSRRETLKCAAEVVDHRILSAAQSQVTARELGAKNWAEVLRIRLRVDTTEANRRVRDALNLAPRAGLTGEPLPPLWEFAAAAQAEGVINTEHVKVIGQFINKLPGWVDPTTCGQFERSLVSGARHQTPEELRAAAEALLYLLDQDGPLPDDADRARKRGLTVSKQRPDGMSDLQGTLTPEARAYLDALLDKYAAPGMCNPADRPPCFSGTPSAEQIAGDTRTAAQRRHDACTALLRMLLASGTLGEHKGVPIGVVATCTVTDLEQRTGVALTHTGSKLPIKDLLQMAATNGADHYLAVFDRHSEQLLYMGRARRTATVAQRFALFARDHGCTKPNCTAPASRSQAHHVDTDWCDGGLTNIGNLALACDCDNVLAYNGGWSTTMKNGRAHWTPPPLLDVGQPRTNRYHHPTLYPPESGGDDGETDSPAS
ncbi:HNH endonuclease signature motif containing protein [Mycolicibacterium sp. lyk4-40-TYG-92]|uniref:HNH endonuclease signature motif containing protein n=1 Tax=Mycolicibacterium sp. lyk4-40-TYG-92 TaxID=3040295 RepID=UPI002550D80A|nr:HNH endonuclease signature motif containing protein [Mycolicibacterium sp. lyk4-40-TYG-92]